MVLAINALVSVGCDCGVGLLSGCEVEEMDRPVRLVVEVFRVVQHKSVAHVLGEVLAIEVVVPNATFRNHKEA